MEKEFATMPITPAVDLDGLLLLLPHELMGSCDYRRHARCCYWAQSLREHGYRHLRACLPQGSQRAVQLYELTLGAAPSMVTALFVLDALSALFIALLAFSAMGVAIMGFAYFHKLADARDEFQLLLSLATLGGDHACQQCALYHRGYRP